MLIKKNQVLPNFRDHLDNEDEPEIKIAQTASKLNEKTLIPLLAQNPVGGVNPSSFDDSSDDDSSSDEDSSSSMSDSESSGESSEGDQED